MIWSLLELFFLVLVLSLLKSSIQLSLLLKCPLLNLHETLDELWHVLTFKGHGEPTIKLGLIVCIIEHVTEGRDYRTSPVVRVFTWIFHIIAVQLTLVVHHDWEGQVVERFEQLNIEDRDELFLVAARWLSSRLFSEPSLIVDCRGLWWRDKLDEKFAHQLLVLHEAENKVTPLHCCLLLVLGDLGHWESGDETWPWNYIGDRNTRHWVLRFEQLLVKQIVLQLEVLTWQCSRLLTFLRQTLH